MAPKRDQQIALVVSVLAASGCGPLANTPANTQYAACGSIAKEEERCATLAPVSVAAIQDECNAQYAAGYEGCPQAIEAFARCLPSATCEELHALTSACTELAGDVATRCGPTTSAQNSNTAQSRGHLF